MSVTVDISERQLRLGVFKLAVSLVGIFALLVVGLSLVFGQGQSIAVNLLLICVGFAMLANGCFAVTKIVDWVEARKVKNCG